MQTPRQAANTVIGILILGSLAYCGYGYATAEQRVRALCAEISPGMSIESRTFGRYGCRVDTENGVVKRSAFSFAD